MTATNENTTTRQGENMITILAYHSGAYAGPYPGDEEEALAVYCAEAGVAEAEAEVYAIEASGLDAVRIAEQRPDLVVVVVAANPIDDGSIDDLDHAEEAAKEDPGLVSLRWRT